MARLYRPHIPLKVRCRVAARQLGLDLDRIMAVTAASLDTIHTTLCFKLAVKFGCKVEDLRLDHDPPLGARQKTGEGKATVYDPPANDPNHLAYRPHGAEFEGSHDVKTRIRGEHGQYSDIALIKRERRRTRKPTPYQKRIEELKERQRQIAKERRRALKKKRGKPAGKGWRSRQLSSKKSPRRFGGL